MAPVSCELAHSILLERLKQYLIDYELKSFALSQIKKFQMLAMSALGQKQTYACPLYPQSGHPAAQTECQVRPKRTLGLLTITGLADNRSLTAPVDEYRSLAKRAALDGPRPHI